ncbi:MAG: hypothetical protein DRI88_02890 [Bacteroidetes bacterium]|nr:MAG: hypothetical protein DRI72_07825 [Bacteroidota bacterium]RLD48574.1 MAG: hypothetical protein DRI88_02890 [Bacteroidota bacterium]RLD73920.1 MAG: hypothetical protein DRI87_02640 [Bacteroidota bacterium]RLD88859.1 MAG: hypothetical protein DRJ02_02930 [Bacteroidota bacterium]
MTGNNNLKIYVVLVNLGAWRHTIECMESLLGSTYTNYSCVVVDVKDIDRSLNHLNNWLEKEKDDRFVLISESENKGFAYANNIGIDYALAQNDGHFMWILNNDTVVNDDALEKLMLYYNENKHTDKIGFLGSKILDYTKRDLIENVGGTFNPLTGYSVLIGMGQQDIGQFSGKKMYVDYVVGASMFLPASLIKEIGLMEEDYFLYFEDVDWCLRAKKAGYVNLTCEDSIVYHKQGISTGVKLSGSERNLGNKKYLYTSYLKLYRKHFKYLIPVAYLILVKQMLGKLFRRNKDEARLILDVLLSR